MGVYRDLVNQAKRAAIERALVETDGNRKRAAALLGITRAHLHAQMRALSVTVPSGRRGRPPEPRVAPALAARSALGRDAASAVPDGVLRPAIENTWLAARTGS